MKYPECLLRHPLCHRQQPPVYGQHVSEPLKAVIDDVRSVQFLWHRRFNSGVQAAMEEVFSKLLRRIIAARSSLVALAANRVRTLPGNGPHRSGQGRAMPLMHDRLAEFFKQRFGENINPNA